MNRMLAASLGGFVATLPMSLAMLGIRRLLPRPQEAKPLPPHAITMGAAHKAGVKDQLESKPERYGASTAAHFGFGAAAGSLYLAGFDKLPWPAPLRGAALGMAVWAGGYFALMPAAGLFPPPPRQTRGHNVVLILAHLVWGVTTVAIYERLTARENVLWQRE